LQFFFTYTGSVSLSIYLLIYSLKIISKPLSYVPLGQGSHDFDDDDESAIIHERMPSSSYCGTEKLMGFILKFSFLCKYPFFNKKIPLSFPFMFTLFE